MLVKKVVGEEKTPEILSQAVAQANLMLIRYLVEEEGVPFDPQAAAKLLSPRSFRPGTVETLIYLVDRGADAKEMMERYEETNCSSTTLLKTLLERGARPRLAGTFSKVVALNDVDLLRWVLAVPPEDWGYFLEAAIGNSGGVRAVLDAGCPITTRDFMAASKAKAKGTLKIFLERGFCDFSFDNLPDEQQKLVRRYYPTLWDHLDD